MISLLARFSPAPKQTAAAIPQDRTPSLNPFLTHLASKALFYEAPESSPAHNRFPSVAIYFDNCGTLALICLRRLVNRDLERSTAFPPVEIITDFTGSELLQLSVILPGIGPESGFPEGPLILSHSQFVLLRKYISQEQRWLSTHSTSRLWDVHPQTLQMCLKALMDAMHRRTKLLTRDELCKLRQ
jgi:hypothetical protein